jgi:hypothetical protein
MRSEFFKQLRKLLAVRSDRVVFTLPGVLYRVRCGNDPDNADISFHMHWFTDCRETLIHNHRHVFDSYCVEGEYNELLWSIENKGDGNSTYKFYREGNNPLDVPTQILGTLTQIGGRHHFPGNLLHINTDIFHSVVATNPSDTRLVTFIRKQNTLLLDRTCFLSPTAEIQGPKDVLCPATAEECQQVYDKLHDLLQTHLKDVE